MNIFAGLVGRKSFRAAVLYAAAGLVSGEAGGLTVLHSFHAEDGGRLPMGRMIVGQDGRLYGTTMVGGEFDAGTVFSIGTDGSSFQLIRSLKPETDGSEPVAGLLQSVDGTLFGLTQSGGVHGGGALFRMSPNGGAFDTVHSFNVNTDGYWPTDELIEGSDGRLYGALEYGGEQFSGTLYAFDPESDSYTVLRSFGFSDVAGRAPRSALLRGSDNRLYGTTSNGGGRGLGTAFTFENDGTGLTVIHEFGSDETEGGRPQAVLIEGVDGRLYGTTSDLGSVGTVFTMERDGSGFTVLHRINTATEGSAAGPLVQAPDGRLFGTLSRGPSGAVGGVFTVMPDGTGFEVIHFMAYGSEGGWPEAGLIFGPDGRLYGVNSIGGVDGGGTVFALEYLPDQPPEIGNPSMLSGRLGSLFVMYPFASRAPASITVEGLPAGLVYHPDGGIIIGRPEAMGAFEFTIHAANAFGSDTKVITLNVGKRLAVVQLAGLEHAYDGTPKSVSVTTTPAGLETVVTYNGSSTPPSAIGTYAVVATINDATNDGVAYGTMHILDPETIAPFITVQPESKNIEIGKPVIFMVEAVGAAPLTYQWRKNYSDIPGATSSSYSIASTTFSDEADYQVVVTNPIGATFSMVATLRVFDPPAIIGQPVVKTVVIGGTASYSVTAIGTGPFTYQWRRDGLNIAGATSAVLTLANVEAWQGGNYSVVVSNAVGSITSDSAALEIDTTPRLINVSCRGVAGSGDNTLVMGFYVNGSGSKTLLIRGVGPRLADFIEEEVVANPSITIYRGETPIDGMEDWDPSLAATFTHMGAFALNPGSKDAAMTITLEASHTYTVHLVNPGPVAEALIEVYDLSRDLGSRLTNVSCRFNMQPGQKIILGTSSIGGSTHVLARNVGPGIAGFLQNPLDALADPHLRVYSGDTEIAVNDDWEAATGAYFGPTGAFGLDADSKDAAIRVPLAVGGHTIHATGKGGTGGIAIIELYESP